MTQYKRIGIDTSKAVFTLHGIDHHDRPVLRINLRRAQMIPFFRNLPPTEIAMEACGAAHYWARELIALGHEVHLIPPQYVKPYVKRSKNDRNDAEAICEAAGRPGMHFVPVKSVTQQAQGMVLKVRETLVGQRTLLINTLRGHATEFGVIAAKGLHQVGPLLAAIEQEPAIPPEAKDMASLLGRQIEDFDTKIKELDAKLATAHKANEVSQRLATSAADAFRHIGSLRDPIPGVGPVTALTLAIEIDPAAFESGRHLAAWAGLTPKELSTGGKQRMGGISRAGNERMRALLVAGAMSVINAAMRPGSKQMTDWLRALLARKPRKVVAVALANKMARVAWALMTGGEVYRRPSAAAT
jgi:transposase